ncbi:MAG: hypothetical protein AAGG01_05595 [Planctomycetota bacterium]
MTPKKRISTRELWLVSLLPAAIVLIFSFAFPGPAKEIDGLEANLARLMSNETQQRLASQLQEATENLSSGKEELIALDKRIADLEAELAVKEAPKAKMLPLQMTDALDFLTNRLAAHGVRVVSMERADGPAKAVSSFVSSSRASRRRRARSGTGSSLASQSADVSGSDASGKARWRVSVAATWPNAHRALADIDAFPPGLGLYAFEMESARPGSSLHRWNFIVSEVGKP